MLPTNLQVGDGHADDWDAHWQGFAESATFNPAQSYRRDLLLRLLRERCVAGESIRLVDIGSGQGDFAEAFVRAFPGASYLGLEISATGIAVARSKVPTGKFLEVNLLETVQSQGEFNSWATHAVCSEVLEHVDKPEVLLENASKFMADNCQMIVTVPGGPRSAFDAYIGHREHFTRASVRQLLERAGLRVEGVECAGFPFFNLYRLAVIARGPRLIRDAQAGLKSQGILLRFAVMVFRFLFNFNLRNCPMGWQVVAVARRP